MEEAFIKKTVLVVDDLPMNRQIISAMLGPLGVNVIEADGADEAVGKSGEYSIDAFLIDVNMPGVNGIELCRLIRAMDKHRNTPLIIVTALQERDIYNQSWDAGIDDFISKPIDAVILKARLRNLLQKASYLKQLELMSHSLQRYVSPRTEEHALGYAKTGVLSAPRQQEVCIVFTDVRGFTELSNELEPEVLFNVLSKQLNSQVSLVYEHGGYVDKFSGDGIMAVFDGEDKALRSCLCALEILKFSEKSIEKDGLDINLLGIGIHMGKVIIGNLGSAQHLDYTLVGRTVNLAARLCGLAGSLRIVTSKAVRDALVNNHELKFSGEKLAAIRGFSEPIATYNLTDSALQS